MTITIKEKSTNLIVYRELLRKAIQEVSSRIHVDVSGITWYIVSENDLQDSVFPNLNSIPNFTPIFKKYGRCNIETKEVKISTDAIQSYGINDIIGLNKLHLPIHLKPNRILLVDVILDEIAHIVSKKSHGDKEYEKLLASYHQLFY